MTNSVVLDTNVYVAYFFNPKSSSAKLIRDVKKEKLTLVWNEKTKSETEKIVKQIPPIKWDKIKDLFKDKNKFEGETGESSFEFVKDPADRKFIALAKKADATLVTNDNHLLSVKGDTKVNILTPKDAVSIK